MTYNEDFVMMGDEGSTDVLCWDTRTGVLLKRLQGKIRDGRSVIGMTRSMLNFETYIILCISSGQNNNVRCVVASPIDDAYLTCR
jgi:cleavage stimulation factor subunit 1